jgi:hypothetical protein
MASTPKPMQLSNDQTIIAATLNPNPGQMLCFSSVPKVPLIPLHAGVV